MKYLQIVGMCMLLLGCSSTLVNPKNASEPLSNNQGYLAIVFDTLDKLTNIRIENMGQLVSMPVGSREPGVSLMLLKVEEGEYCFEGFDVYNMQVEYKNRGICTYVDAGEMNYFGDFIVRDPVSTQRIVYPRFVGLLNQHYPTLCQQYIGRGCH